VSALLGSQVEALASGPSAVIGQIKGGKLRAARFLGRQAFSLRSPDVPTFKELGYNASSTSWSGLFAPAGARPRPFWQNAENAARQAVDDPDFKNAMAKIETPAVLPSTRPSSRSSGQRREGARRRGENAGRQSRRQEVGQSEEVCRTAQGKVIITCAVTGAIHTPTMSPHLPITAGGDCRRRDRGGASRRGDRASARAREPADGPPTQDPKMFMRFCRRSRRLELVINLTTGGAPTMTVEEAAGSRR